LSYAQGGSRHDPDQTKPPNQAQTETVGDDLGDPGSLVGEDPPHPLEILAQKADRPPRSQLARRPQWHHLPDAHRLPVGATAPQVRPQEHRPRLVPALVQGGRHGADLGRLGRGLRRVGRGGLAVAECRRLAGQVPVRGGKRRARIPPTVARWGPRSRWSSMARVGRWAWRSPGPTS
jgi:hypothetical protein